MRISDGWIRTEAPNTSPEDRTILLASDNDSAGTIEEIRWLPATGQVFRRRWWAQSWRTGPAGEVWFKREKDDGPRIELTEDHVAKAVSDTIEELGGIDLSWDDTLQGAVSQVSQCDISTVVRTLWQSLAKQGGA